MMYHLIEQGPGIKGVAVSYFWESVRLSALPQDERWCLDLKGKTIQSEEYAAIFLALTSPNYLRLPDEAVVISAGVPDRDFELFLEGQGLSVYYIPHFYTSYELGLEENKEWDKLLFTRHKDLSAFLKFASHTMVSIKNLLPLLEVVNSQNRQLFWLKEQNENLSNFLEINKKEAKKEISYFKKEVENYAKWYDEIYGHQPKWFTLLGKVFKLFRKKK